MLNESYVFDSEAVDDVPTDENVPSETEPTDNPEMMQEPTQEDASMDRVAQIRKVAIDGIQEYADDILEQIRKAEIETETILERVDSIKAIMVDVEDTRKNFMDKVYSLERDMAKIEKNDKKVQLFISKLEELNVIIEVIQNQRENLTRMKNQYDDYDKNIVKNLERAEYFVRYLETLLDNADKYMSDNGAKGTAKKASKVDTKKEEFIIKMYQQGWKLEEIVKNTSYSRDEVEKTIKAWKNKQSRL